MDIILSYGELDPSEEREINLNSALFTPGEGSRQTHEKGNNLARRYRNL